MQQPKLKNILGVNLLELLIVITIISILTAIAYPNYIKFKLETRRTDAHTMIVKVYSTIQNFLIASNNIALQASDLSTLFTLPVASDGGYYSINVAISSPNYTITATAVETQQLNDTNCRQIIMDNNGSKSSKNSAGTASTGCW